MLPSVLTDVNAWTDALEHEVVEVLALDPYPVTPKEIRMAVVDMLAGAAATCKFSSRFAAQARAPMRPFKLLTKVRKDCQ